MFRPRVIPVLLLKGQGLVKTVGFKNPRYIGDPINAVRIFNDLKADELIFLDIEASRQNRVVSPDLVRQIGDEAFMPFSVGGGIRTIEDMRKLLQAGAEKVVINSATVGQYELIERAAAAFGKQSIVVSIDVKKNWLGRYVVRTHSGQKKTPVDVVSHAVQAAESGAGEVLINSIDNDGRMGGFDIELIRQVAEAIQVPVVACGGAGTLEHLREAVVEGGAHAVGAGSMFVYHGPRNAVLVNYPEQSQLFDTFRVA